MSVQTKKTCTQLKEQRNAFSRLAAVECHPWQQSITHPVKEGSFLPECFGWECQCFALRCEELILCRDEHWRRCPSRQLLKRSFTSGVKLHCVFHCAAGIVGCGLSVSCRYNRTHKGHKQNSLWRMRKSRTVLTVDIFQSEQNVHASLLVGLLLCSKYWFHLSTAVVLCGLDGGCFWTASSLSPVRMADERHPRGQIQRTTKGTFNLAGIAFFLWWPEYLLIWNVDVDAQCFVLQELMFCETCDTVFCVVCTGGSHNGRGSAAHTVIPFSIAIKRMSEILLYKVSETSNRCLKEGEQITNKKQKIRRRWAGHTERFHRFNQKCSFAVSSALRNLSWIPVDTKQSGGKKLAKNLQKAAWYA